MFFLKKVILSGLFVVLMYLGGIGTQSSSSSLQGLGFTGVIVALVVLFILFKIMWTAMSFFMWVFIIGGLVAFTMYCLGMFGDSSSLHRYINSNMFSVSDTTEQKTENVAYTEYGKIPDLAELNVSEPEAYDSYDYDETVDAGGVIGQMKSWLFGSSGGQEADTQFDFNPMDYPAVNGPASVITAGVLNVSGIYVKLLGIDAPDVRQTCSNHRGQAYRCGQSAITWLQNWINGREVECRILGRVVNHWATGVCFIGQYDIAAVVTNAGWAVAYTKNTDAYVPYEEQAMAKKSGMWSGKFYRPRDWRKLQTRSAEVEIKQKDGGSGWFDFDGWF